MTFKDPDTITPDDWRYAASVCRTLAQALHDEAPRRVSRSVAALDLAATALERMIGENPHGTTEDPHHPRRR